MVQKIVALKDKKPLSALGHTLTIDLIALNGSKIFFGKTIKIKTNCA